MDAQLALRVCLVLEVLAAHCNADPTNEFAFTSRAYRWAHCATDPGCAVEHPSWLAEFETVEAELIAAKQILDIRGGAG